MQSANLKTITIENITFQYPVWFLALCILLGVIYASALYFREQKFNESPKWSKLLMSVLRFLSVTGIAILLLGPFVRTINEDIQQPTIVIAEDNSKSVAQTTSESLLTETTSAMDQLAAGLEENFQVERIQFGDGVQTGKVDSFGAEVTNISQALEYIYSNYADRNLGAVVMSTDGIFNEGKNPLYANAKLTAPLYVMALGDTTVRKDVLIKNVFSNKIAYLNDKFSIQIDVAAQNANGASTAVTVSRMNGKTATKLKSEAIRINESDYFTTKEIVLDADKAGVVKYRIAVNPVGGEVSNANNYKDIYVEVLDARQKVLLLANAPHPDLSALKSIITSNKNYEAVVQFPEDNVNVAEYDVVVLHNLPSAKHNITNELTLIGKRRIPSIYFVGAQTKVSTFNGVQDLVKIIGNSSELEDVNGDVNGSFNSFTISDKLSNTLKTFPPLVAPFGEYSNPAGANVFLKQNIKKIPTNYPLLSFQDKSGTKSAVWIGEGVWRWRLFDFLQNKNYDLTNELVNKTIQYLSVKNDKRKFRVSSSKNLYKENEQVYLDAQLYNDNYEMINEPDVFLELKNADGKVFKYTFSRNNNYYTLDLGNLIADRYTYTASTNYNGEAMTQKGSFNVQDIQLELYNLTARHGLLKTLTDKYGGEVFYPGDGDVLATTIAENSNIKPVVYQNVDTKSVLNFKWLFWLFMALLGGEWFFRRFWGSY